MTDKQSAKASDGSVVLQGQGDVSYYAGLQYEDSRLLIRDLFDMNFERIVADAGAEAARRAAEVDDAFVRKLQQLPREILVNLAEPGVQRALVQAQVEHATYGDANAAEVYATLLVDRLAHPAKDLTSIACQKAIETVGQLTSAHMDLLSCIFVVIEYVWTGADSLESLQSHFRRLLAPVAHAITGDLRVLRYLDSTTCLALDTTRAYNVAQLVRGQTESFGGVSVEGDNAPFELVASGDNNIRSVFEAFQAGEGFLKSCFLTPRGLAIAHANLLRHDVGPLPPVEIWIQRSKA